MKQLVAVVILAAVGGCSVCRPSVVGRVLDENGNGVEGVLVTIYGVSTKYPDTQPGERQIAAKRQTLERPEVLSCDATAPDGTFSLKGHGLVMPCLPVYNYRVHLHRAGFTDVVYDFESTYRSYFIVLPTKRVGNILMRWNPTDPLLAPAAQN